MIQSGAEQRMVFKGLETVRTDWTPLAQQFQQKLYLRIFRNEPYQEFVRETIDRLMAGELDEHGVPQTPAPPVERIPAECSAARSRRTARR